MRQQIGGARRVVVKIGSSSLTNAGTGLSAERLDALVDAIAAAVRDGRQVVVVSSGAIAAGLAPLQRKTRPRDLATQQAAASVGQLLLISRYAASFARYGLTVGQVLLTAEDLIRRSHYRNALRTFSRLLEFGVVPIVNENDTVATAEIRFGDNDRLAALTAHLLHADALILLSDVDGLYDAHPRSDRARLIQEVNSAADLAGVDTSGSGGQAGTGGHVGTGGMASKIDAAQLASSAGIPVVLAAAAAAGPALQGADVGTYFHPTGGRLPTRLLWLRHATHARGRLVLDPGAVAAVRERGASLLAAGVTAAQGDFVAGDPVELVDTDGTEVGRGLIAFDAEELPGLLGRSSHQLAAEFRRELVHRDDMVLS